MSSEERKTSGASVGLQPSSPSSLWFVMDMDGTILPTPSKAHGRYTPLDESPCFPHVCEWLRRGHHLCVVSTAGWRMWQQLVEPLAKHVWGAAAAEGSSSASLGRLVVAGFSGGALFIDDRSSSGCSCLPGITNGLRMQEVESYRHEAVAGGTCLSDALRDHVIDVCCGIVRQYLRDACDDGSRITALSRKYHDPYRRLVAQANNEYDSWDAFAKAVLPREAMLEHGRFLSETNDALVDVQAIPGTSPPVAAQVTALGIPMKLFGQYFDQAAVIGELEKEHGLHVKPQPNSVCITRSSLDKATVVKWMEAHGESPDSALPFRLIDAVAFGDNPEVVDRPLTIFPQMPFVSLSPAAKLPEPLLQPHVLHVGGEEEGCAKVLQAILARPTASLCGPGGAPTGWDGTVLRQCVSEARGV